MNFHKGEATGGLGASFKTATDYYLYDKETGRDRARREKEEEREGRGDSFAGRASYALHDKGGRTQDRVGAVEMLNLASKDPEEAWREMQATADAAPALKARAGIGATGQKCQAPAYAYSLEWHPADRPTTAQMMAAARETVKALGLEEHQVLIVEHVDKPHKHVHVLCNLIHPDTGRTASLWKDEAKLDYYCYRYEVRAGIIRSPERANKYEGREHHPNHVPYQQYMAEKQRTLDKAANDNRTRERVKRVRAEYALYADRLKATQNGGYQRRMAEKDRLYRQYQDERAAIQQAHQEQIAAIWKRKRERSALPFSRQGYRDWQENRDWAKLGAQQKQRSAMFRQFEQSAMGRLYNAVRLAPGAMKEGRSGLGAAFHLALHAEERRRLFEARLQEQRQQLIVKHGLTRNRLAEKVKQDRDLKLATLVRSWEEQRQALNIRHDRDIAAEQATWRALQLDRGHAEDQARRERPAQQRSQRQPEDLTMPTPHPFDLDPVVAAAVERAMQGPKPEREVSQHRETGGWSRRRSAQERKAAGIYRDRDREIEL